MPARSVRQRPFKYVTYLETGLGRIGLAEQGGAVCDLFFTDDAALLGAVERKTRLLTRAVREVREYLAGRRREFDLPLLLDGTDFERAVWAAVRAIPYGCTASYRRIAEAAGRPRAARGVGAAVRRGRISLCIPFHRVIRSDGSVAGEGPDSGRRSRLLDLERRCLAARAEGSVVSLRETALCASALLPIRPGPIADNLGRLSQSGRPRTGR